MIKLDQWIEEVKGLEEKASKGPWDAGWSICCPDRGWVDKITNGSSKLTEALDINDAEFIAHARQDLPRAIRIIERMREALIACVNLVESAERDSARECLKEIEEEFEG